MQQALWIIATIALVAINGFFVAAEFALVKVRVARLTELAAEGRPFAKTGLWLHRRMDKALSACQLGITMASLGLGWVGEPAIARLLEPLFEKLGMSTGPALHTVSFLIAFTLITAAHLVLGEQAPKIFALRRAEEMTLRCALPLKWFYFASYPFNAALDKSTSILLRMLGLTGGAHDGDTASEQEIRALLSVSHAQGELTRHEHQMLEAVFEFDDRLCRQIMVPRADVVYFRVGQTYDEIIAEAKRSRHTRYPVCRHSLDDVLGFVHLKDLVGQCAEEFNLLQHIRPPQQVPETSPLRRLLGRFKAGRQHLAFVVDEHGSVSGIVTLENVLEQLVGQVQDEFDDENPQFVSDGPGKFLVDGSMQLDSINRLLELSFSSDDVDTLGGLVMQKLDRVVRPGDRVDFDDCTAEVLEVRNSRAERIRLTIGAPAEDVEGAGG